MLLRLKHKQAVMSPVQIHHPFKHIQILCYCSTSPISCSLKASVGQLPSVCPGIKLCVCVCMRVYIGVCEHEARLTRQ